MNELRPAIFCDRDGVLNKNKIYESGDPRGYILCWKDFEFLPGVMEAMFRLYASKYEVFVLSNQSGISRNIMAYGKPITARVIWQIFNRMEETIASEINSRLLCNAGLPGEPQLPLAASGPVPLERSDPQTPADDMKVHRAIRESIFCPHHPKAGCCCRKPKPGMIYYLARKYGIDLKKSWMIGDQDSDIDAGLNAGVSHLVKIEHSSEEYVAGSMKRTARSRKPISPVDIPVLPTLLNAVEYIEDLDKWEEEHGR